MSNYLLGIFTALLAVFVLHAMIDGAVGRAANKVNAAILDCVEEKIITADQAHQICEKINKDSKTWQ